MERLDEHNKYYANQLIDVDRIVDRGELSGNFGYWFYYWYYS